MEIYFHTANRRKIRLSQVRDAPQANPLCGLADILAHRLLVQSSVASAILIFDVLSRAILITTGYGLPISAGIYVVNPLQAETVSSAHRTTRAGAQPLANYFQHV
jgi:hypothetical protein